MFNYLHQFERKLFAFARDKKGSLVTIAAFAFPVLVLATGAAVDYNRINDARAKLASAVSASTSNATTILEQVDSPQAEANKLFNTNFPDGYMGSKRVLNQDGVPLTITSQKVDNKLQVKGHAEIDLPLSFAGALGMEDYHIEHTAVFERMVKPNVEIVLTMDVSPSVCALDANDPASPLTLIPDPNCTKLKLMKSAMSKFVDHVFKNSALDSVKIGIMPYNHKINLADKNQIPPTLAAPEAATPNYYSDLSDASPLPAIIPLTSDKDTLLKAIDAIQMDVTARGWTRTTLGTHAAALMLDPSQHQYFGGVTPVEFGDPKAEKIIVQLTEGSNTGCCFGDVDGDFTKQYMYLYKTDMDNQRQLCEQIKKPTSEQGGGMTIFSIMFNVTDDELTDNDSENIAGIERTGGKWIKDVFLGCASNKQFYFDISMNGNTNGSAESEIEKAYLGIASYLYKQRQVYNF